MCLIVTKEARRAFDLRRLSEAVRLNKDGYGLAVWDPRTGWVARHTLDAKEFLGWARAATRYRAVAHMRAATSGAVDLARCHPFSIGRGRWIAHNGAVTALSKHEERSDTEKLAEILSYLPDELVLRTLHAIGGGRYAIMFSDGKVERVGTWYNERGIWYSSSPCSAKSRFPLRLFDFD
jgi:predicted glutamine amidotransferase